MKKKYPSKNYKKSPYFSYIKVFIILIMLGLNVDGFGQGTTCSNATAITVNGSCLAATINDSSQTTPNISGCSAGTFRREGWYTFTISGGTANVVITGMSENRNLYLQLMSPTSSCSGLAQIACANDDDNNNSAQTESITATLPNGIYYIKVVSVGNNNNMILNSLCVTTFNYTNCIPSVTSGQQASNYINTVRFLGTLQDITNTSTYSNSPIGYQDFTGLATKAIQAAGEGVNIAIQNQSLAVIKVWVDWNNDGDFIDADETVFNSPIAVLSTTFGFVVPAGITPGDYKIRIRINSSGGSTTFNSCGNINNGGETEDYLLTVIANCSTLITSISNGETCGSGPVALVATATADVTEFRWYTTATGGSYVATPTGNWITPSLTATTTYYVAASNGCESLVRIPVVAKISPIPDVSFTPAVPIVCGDDTVISLTAGGDVEEVFLINETFESGGLGSFTNVNTVNNGGTINAKTQWQVRTSSFIPAEQVWFPAISSGFNSNKFAMTTSDVGSYTIHNELISSTVNSTGFLNLTLTLRMYYSRYLTDGVTPTNDYVTIDVSTNGSTWNEMIKYTSDVGIGTKFSDLTFDLSSYINQANLRVRVRYYATYCDGVAVDDIKLFGNKPLNTAFQWTSATPVDAFSDSACVTPYVSGTPAATVYIRPTLLQLENSSFTITASSILSNGCSATKDIIVANNTKLWAGDTNSDWDNASNWKPFGIPTIDNCLIINEEVNITGTAYEAYGKSLKVKGSGQLNVSPENNITISEAVTVESGGIFVLEDAASLIQEGTINANTGNITVKRNTQPVKRYDFTYWSSPVAPQLLSNLAVGTLADKYYSWNPTTQAWSVHYNGNINMASGKGYIARAPQSFSITTAAVYNGEFSGVPNSGDITIAISGSPTVNKWNLIGNPYPSAIEIDKFFQHPDNASNVAGTIYLWTHNSPPSDAIPGDAIYNYTSSDYATYNATGGTATAPAVADPLLPVISSNFNSTTPNGFVASGQSFFVRGLADANVRFTNEMRAKGENNQFFRSENNQTDSQNTNTEKSRFWLNIRNGQGAFNQALIGYLQGATNEFDNGYDGELLGGNYVTIYSLNSSKKLSIQGRALPFEISDVIPLGIKTTIAGTFSIGLDTFDGLFENQAVFLKDNLLNMTHDLKTGAYSFTASVGTFENRFEIVYEDVALGIENPFNPDSVIIYKKNETIVVNSGVALLQQIQVYDIQGRLLYTNKDIRQIETVIENLPPVDQVLLVQITTLDGIKVAKKIIY